MEDSAILDLYFARSEQDRTVLLCRYYFANTQRELLTSRDGIYIRDIYTVRYDRAYTLEFWSNMRLLTDGTLEYIQQNDDAESVARFRIADGQLLQTLRLGYAAQEGRYLQDADLDCFYDTELTADAYGTLVADKAYASVSWQSIDDLP